MRCTMTLGLAGIMALAGCGPGRDRTAAALPPGPVLPTTAYQIEATPTAGESFAPLALGQGIDALSGAPRQACVAAPAEPLSGSVGYLSSAPMDGYQALLGLQPDDLPGRRAADLPAAARRFAQEMAAAPRSTSWVYALGEYELTSEQLRLTFDAATALAADGPDFSARCGDWFAATRTRGGQLFLLIRSDYLHDDAVRDCRLVGTVEVGTLEAPARYLACAGRMAVHVAVLQRGGDPGPLSARLRAAGSAAVASLWSRDCPAADVRPCRDFVRQAVDHAFATGPAGFTAGLAQQPANLRVNRQTYTVLGLPLHNPRQVPDQVLAARAFLQARRAEQEALEERLRVLQAGLYGSIPALEARLPATQATVAGNLSLLEVAEARCWGQFTDPADAAQLAACADGATDAALAAVGYDATLTAEALVP